MSFTPNLISESGNFFTDLSLPNLQAGKTFGVERVVKNDGKEILFCYEYSDKNCNECTEVSCPFKPKSGLKEMF